MYEANNQKATLIALNYNFASGLEFSNKLEEKEILNKYHLKSKELQLAEQLPPKEILAGLRALFPYVYSSEDTTIQIVYTQNEFKLSIEKNNINKDNFQTYKDLSNDIIDLKLSDISAMGMNYSAEFNLGDNRLDILNEKITGIKDFDKNLTIDFKIPISYPERNLIASYRLRKIKGGDKTQEPHIYEVSVNFHFDLKLLSTGEKGKRLENILSYDLYEEFFNKCQEFLKLNNGNK